MQPVTDYIDDVIEPRNTRFRIIQCLAAITDEKVD